MWRQLRQSLPLALLLGLTACTGSGLEEGEAGYIEGFFGGIMVDEARAAIIGREVLSAGGTAADAVVAAYFTAAVTMPGGASLGGGGLCLIHDRSNGRVDSIDFLARAPAHRGAAATVAVPGNIRGMAFLQARYGRLSWADLLVPAESFAREGHGISRAFVNDLVTAAPMLRDDPEARRIFGLDTGPIAEGQLVRQVELAAVISVVRSRGAGEFYGGPLGRQFVEALGQLGATMTLEDLRDYRPQLSQPIQAEIGDNLIYFPPPPAVGGVLAAQLWAAGRSGSRYTDGDAGERIHLLAEVGSRAYARQAAELSASDPLAATTIASLVAGHDQQRRQPTALKGPPIFDDAAQGNHDGMTIVAADLQGQAVACAFTLNRPFGTGQIAPGTGILLATPVALTASQPSAVMVANPNTDQVFFGAAISGGSPATLAAVTLETLADGRDLGAAITQPRAYDTGNPDVLIAEPTLAASARSYLEGLGYGVQARPGLGRINGFRCPEGLPRRPVCQFVADPRGYGLAVSADQ